MRIDRRKLFGLSAAGAGVLLLERLNAKMSAIIKHPGVGPVVEKPDHPHVRIGMNLAGIADYEPGFPFHNLFWGARQWMTQNAHGKGPWDTEAIGSFALDPQGYPLEVPINVPGISDTQIPFTVIPNVGKAGKYVMLYDGEGTIAGVMGTSVISSSPGRVVLRMTNRIGLVEGIAIKRSVRGNHIRNIRILALEDEHVDLIKNPFLPEFIDFCRPFHALRFMDWAVTNGSLEQEWANRKKLDFYTMVGSSGDADGRFGKTPSAFDRLFSGGVAIELMIDLANLLETDPWFCIPHRATDEYIREFARLVKAKLNPRLKVYLEYSNEVWNWGFIQAGWMLNSRLAGDLVEARGGKPWNDAAKTKGNGHPERIGALLRRAFAIWETEWAGADRKRLIRVCAVQAAWLDASQRTVNWCAQYGGADAVAPAAYVGANGDIYAKWATKGSALTAEEVLFDLNRVLDHEFAGGNASALAALAHQLNMTYLTYEGGQSLEPKGHAELPYNAALAAAQQHPGMYDIYVRNLKLQQSLGSTLFCAFSSVGRQGTRWGSWGAKARYDQPLAEAPKMRALLDCNQPKLTS